MQANFHSTVFTACLILQDNHKLSHGSQRLVTIGNVTIMWPAEFCCVSYTQLIPKLPGEHYRHIRVDYQDILHLL